MKFFGILRFFRHYYKTYRQREVAAYMYFAIIIFSHIFLGSFFIKIWL